MNSYGDLTDMQMCSNKFPLCSSDGDEEVQLPTLSRSLSIANSSQALSQDHSSESLSPTSFLLKHSSVAKRRRLCTKPLVDFASSEAYEGSVSTSDDGTIVESAGTMTSQNEPDDSDVSSDEMSVVGADVDVSGEEDDMSAAMEGGDDDLFDFPKDGKGAYCLLRRFEDLTAEELLMEMQGNIELVSKILEHIRALKPNAGKGLRERKVMDLLCRGDADYLSVTALRNLAAFFDGDFAVHPESLLQSLSLIRLSQLKRSLHLKRMQRRNHARAVRRVPRGDIADVVLSLRAHLHDSGEIDDSERDTLSDIDLGTDDTDGSSTILASSDTSYADDASEDTSSMIETASESGSSGGSDLTTNTTVTTTIDDDDTEAEASMETLDDACTESVEMVTDTNTTLPSDSSLAVMETRTEEEEEEDGLVDELSIFAHNCSEVVCDLDDLDEIITEFQMNIGCLNALLTEERRRA